MSNTPRTDGLTILAQLGMIPACNIVPAVFDRQLKRELAEVTKQRDELLEALNKLIDKVTDIRGIDMEAYAAEEIAAAEHVIKKMKEKCNN